MDFSLLLELNKFHNNDTPQEETRKHSSKNMNQKKTGYLQLPCQGIQSYYQTLYTH